MSPLLTVAMVRVSALGNTARKKRGSRCRADKFGKLHFIPPECHTGKYNTEFFSRVNIFLTRVNK
jgi:hypothetical protein